MSCNLAQHLKPQFKIKMGEKYKIAIVASSVGLRIRPPATSRKENKNYGNILSQMISKSAVFYKDDFEIKNFSKSRLLSSELRDLQDAIAQFNPDLLILNIGAVDAPNREIPRWFSDITFRRKATWFYPIMNFVYQYFIKSFLRKPMVYLRCKSPWVGKRKFEAFTSQFLQFLKKDIHCKTIVLGINAGNFRIEKELPGSLKNYKTYNGILERLANKNNISFASMEDLNSKDHFPDGVHFNTNGHQKCAEKILEFLPNA